MKESTVEHKGIMEAAAAARKASLKMASIKHAKRVEALHMMADEIEKTGARILEANEKDLNAAQALLGSGKINQSAFKRLSLNEEKLADIVNGIRQVAALPDPVGKTLFARELDDGLVLHQITCPVGVIAVIFESRPDALPQIVSLCVKSGNAAILKGGKEAEQTNSVIFNSLQNALRRAGLEPSAYALTHQREHVQTLLAADKLIDLIIPRGSNELVRQIMDNTRIPVLGHAPRAESLTNHRLGYDVIGMTNLGEAKCAREAEIAYATMAMITDYDCWKVDEAHVTVEMVVANLMKNATQRQGHRCRGHPTNSRRTELAVPCGA